MTRCSLSKDFVFYMKKTSSTEFFSENFKISDACLAPMAGVTDAAFRKICVQNGCRMTFSEMVSAKGLVYQNKTTKAYLVKDPEEKCAGVQIFGNDPAVMGDAVSRFLNDSEFDFIDINMGCPVRKIYSNGEGSALLRDMNLVFDIASAVVKASSKPVSAKIRIGTEGKIIASEAAAALSEAGAGLVSIHGRTREQMYSGAADWQAVADAVRVSDIPVMANGDVTDADSYLRIKEVTGCSGVMIGRGALGNPFIFRQISEYSSTGTVSEIRTGEKILTAKRHFAYLLEYKDERTAVNEFRKHFAWYTKGIKGSASLRNEINQLAAKDEIFGKLDYLYSVFRDD